MNTSNSHCRIPLLRSFNFRFSDRYRLGCEWWKTRAFLDDACISSGHIRRITFSPITSKICIAMMSLPWRQLTHITIRRTTASPSFACMFQAILPRLHLLDVYLWPCEDGLCRLFRMFTLPALVHLKIRCKHDEAEEASPQLATSRI